MIKEQLVQSAVNDIPVNIEINPNQRTTEEATQNNESSSQLHEKYKAFLQNSPSVSPETFAKKEKTTAPRSSHQTRPRTESSADETTGIEKLFAMIVSFFTEGNPVVRVGMVVMFFGLSFLVMYAANKGFFPIEFRLSIVAATAIGLIVLGWRTREKEGGYGMVLQGGGVASLYLTIFASTKFYSILPLKLAFALMFVVVVFGVFLAVLQNAQVLALMATAGGFMVPILTSDGSKNYVGLFTFYLFLNIGILSVAWFKTWRLLNWVGFMFTFVIFGAWAMTEYKPENYSTTQPFLIAYYGLYLTILVLFSIKQPPNLKGLVDGSLMFGMPVATFGLQVKMLNDTEYGLAYSAVVLSVVYIGLALVLWKKYIETHRLLIECFVALGFTFGTLAIPLAFSAEWTSASWALEAAGLIWVGIRQKRLRPRVVGCLLYVAAVVSLFIHGGLSAGPTPIITGDFMSIIMLSASALCIGYVYHRYAKQNDQGSPEGFLAVLVGWIWWLIAGYMELDGHLEFTPLVSAVIAFFTISCFAFSGASNFLQWPQLKQFKFWLLPLNGLWVLGSFAASFHGHEDLHPTEGFLGLALLFFIASQYWFLWQQKLDVEQIFAKGYHIASAWFLFCLMFWEAYYWQGQFGWKGTSALMFWLACFTLPLISLLFLTTKKIWPFSQYESEYKNAIPAPLMALVGFWLFFSCAFSGTDYYYIVPILNPFDLAMFGIIGLFAVTIKCNFLNFGQIDKPTKFALFGLAIFVAINIVLLRALSYFVGVDYEPDELWKNYIVQMSVSILWTLCALVVMKLSRQKMDRQLWKVGAILLVMVVFKLFTKDLSGRGTLERIISFMVVGGLMLLIGYLAPLPSKVSDKKEEEQNPPINPEV